MHGRAIVHALVADACQSGGHAGCRGACRMPLDLCCCQQMVAAVCGLWGMYRVASISVAAWDVDIEKYCCAAWVVPPVCHTVCVVSGDSGPVHTGPWQGLESGLLHTDRDCQLCMLVAVVMCS